MAIKSTKSRRKFLKALESGHDRRFVTMSRRDLNEFWVYSRGDLISPQWITSNSDLRVDRNDYRIPWEVIDGPHVPF